MTVLMSMNRRGFLRYGIAATTGLLMSSKDIRFEYPRPVRGNKELRSVIQKYGSEFGGIKFEKEG